MFSSPTTIIIGAGSSVDYGLPLGKALWDQIVDDCDSLPKHYSQYLAKDPFGAGDYFRHASKSNPKAYAFFWLMRNDRGTIEQQQANAFADNIKRANVHDNVDDFVRDNPSFKKHLQALIAGNLFMQLYQHEEDKSRWALRPRIFGRMFREPSPSGKNVENWIRHFIGLCRNQLQLVPQSKGVLPVTVISFNYDRLMESVLREFWGHSEMTYPTIDDCFTFLYPYGAFSELKSHVPDAGRWLVGQSEQIAITGSGPSP